MIVDDGNRGLHPLFIIENHAVLGLGFQLFRVSAVLGFFPPFSHYFIFFLPFWRLLPFWRNFGYFLEEKRVLWPFGSILSLLEAF